MNARRVLTGECALRNPNVDIAQQMGTTPSTGYRGRVSVEREHRADFKRVSAKSGEIP